MCYNWVWKRFVQFLKRNNCYEQYRFNYENMGVRWKIEHFSEKSHVKLYHPREYVCAAFEWSKTKEGHLYWSFLNNDWGRIVNKFYTSLTNEKTFY